MPESVIKRFPTGNEEKMSRFSIYVKHQKRKKEESEGLMRKQWLRGS